MKTKQKDVFNVILCEDSKNNFYLTRFESLKKACYIKKINLRVSLISEINTSEIKDSIILIPYVTFKKIGPKQYNFLFKNNTILLSVGDEELDMNITWQTLCDECHFYICYNLETQNFLKKHRSNVLLVPEGFSIKTEINNPVKKNKLIYIGAPFKGRQEIINNLINQSFEIDIYGSKKWLDTNLKDNYKGYIENDNYYSKISEYKIFLALTSGEKIFNCHPNAKLGDSLTAKTIALTEKEDITIKEYPNSISSIKRFRNLYELNSKVNEILKIDKESYELIINKSIKEASKLNIYYQNSYSNLLDEIIFTEKINENLNWKINYTLFIGCFIKFNFLHIKDQLKLSLEIFKKNIDDFNSKYLYIPLSIIFRNKYFFIQSISFIKYDIEKNKLSFSLNLKNRNKKFFPNSKNIYFKLLCK